MEIRLPLGKEEKLVQIPAKPSNVFTAKNQGCEPARSWEALVNEALRNPVNTARLSEMSLKGKKIALLVDDKTRSTPIFRIAPILLRELNRAGVNERDVVIVIACGLHEKMARGEVEKKLGMDLASTYEVEVHDAFDEGNLKFYGMSKYGTPIWINRKVASTDFRIAIGRIAQHSAFGYEGGSKMILPGISGYNTIMHNHSMIQSPLAGYGTHAENPCRQDADETAGIVGLDFIVNVVVNFKGEPFKAFAGHYKSAHKLGVEYGNEHVWGACIPQRADVTFASTGSDTGRGRTSVEFALNMAALGTKKGGTIILFAPDVKHRSLFRSAARYLRSSFFNSLQRQMEGMSYEELLKEYCRRDLNETAREIHRRCKRIREEMTSRKPFLDKKIVLVGNKVSKRILMRLSATDVTDVADAVEAAFSRLGQEYFVLVLPEALSTQPIVG